MGKLYYFQAPSLNINPESPSAPKLGSIFATLETLTSPLNQYEYVSPPLGLMNESSNTNFRETRRSTIEASAGINASSAYGIGGSADLIYAFARERSKVYTCLILKTTEFSPTPEFVAECIHASLPVQNFMDRAFVGRKRVYMVTGLKVATDLSVSESKEVEHGPKLMIGVDASVVGVPMQAGPELEVVRGEGRAVSHSRAVNKIIFAYRVIRIKMKWDGQAEYKYKSGGKYDVDESDDDSDDDENADAGEEQWDLEPLMGENIEKDFPNSVKMTVEEGQPKFGLAIES